VIKVSEWNDWKTRHLDICQLECAQPLDKDHHIRIIGPDGVGRKIQSAEAVEADEDVVGEDGEPIIGKRE
jgi:hypothetical protein